MSDDPVWKRIDRELELRKAQHRVPNSWAALGDKVGATSQVTTNWKARGVPPKRYADIAAALGWTVERLMGGEDAQPAPEKPALVSMHQRVFEALSQELQEAVHAHMLKLMSNVTPGVAQNVRGQHLGGMNTNFGDLPEEDQKKAGGGRR